MRGRWLKDIAHTDRFDQTDWQAMGAHHAQALFARCWNGEDVLPHGKNTLYLECVQEAAKYELARTEGFEKDYWRTFIITLNVCYLKYQNRWGLFVATHHGRTIANARTGTLIG